MAAVSGFSFDSARVASRSDPPRGQPSRGGLPRRTYLAALAAVLAAALVLQLGLFGIGFHRVSFDESARSLMALDLSWANALEPFIWPPFYKLFVGLFLKLWGDVFLVPRLLVGAAGLLAILALVRLSDLLFGDRRVNLLTAVLAVAFPHRLIFSVAPLSDIYAYLFLLAAAGCVLAWLRRGSVAQLLLGCACVLGAETVRFEVGSFAVVAVRPGAAPLAGAARARLRRRGGRGGAPVRLSRLVDRSTPASGTARSRTCGSPAGNTRPASARAASTRCISARSAATWRSTSFGTR